MSVMKERGYPVKVQCRMCGKEHTLYVGLDDWFMYQSPNRPHIQDIFPYLTPSERELLISGTCEECWKKLFPPEPDEFDDEEDFDNE